jgi:hypothetical protein
MALTAKRTLPRLDGREPRGGRGGGQPRDDARERGRPQPDGDEGEPNLGREDLAHGHGHDGPTQDAHDAARRGQDRRLHEELALDVPAACAQGHPQPDLLCPLEDGDEHDVGDDDGSHDERDPGDQDHQAEGPGRDGTPERLDRLRADDAEGIV